MSWFLNNNHPGAAEAVMRFAWDNEELDSVYFTYSELGKTAAIRTINQRNVDLARRGLGAYQRSGVLCDVIVIEGRVPNKDIIELDIYPPLPEGRQAELMDELRLSMDLANTDAA